MAHHQNTTESDEEELIIKPLKTKLDIFWFLVPLVSALSVASVIVSVSTNGWLHTMERMPNPDYNGTGEKEYLFKKTVSGLWKYCYTNPGENQYFCKRIDYFAQEDYSPDLEDSTLVIPYVVSKSAIFFLLANCMMMAAFVCCILGQCVRYRGIHTFISGLLFIFTGLLMLLGLIVYISVFKSEVGSKLRPQSQIRPPLFEYEYGYSLLLYIVALFSTKLSGVGCVFLFMYRVQYHWKRKEYDELRKGNRPHSIANLQRIMDSSTPVAVEYPCRRHPYYYINSNSTMTFPKSPARNRYPPPPKEASHHHESPCTLHRSRFHQSTPSLKDVSTSFYNFPPPPTISYQFDEHFSNRAPLSRDVTVNTVSTTADVNLDDLPEPYFDEYSPNLQHEFVAFDLDEPLPIRAQSIVSISSRGGNSRKNYENDTMRRTTPV
ncbi:unnamed protein product [Ceutorhynchus assimilis]|uniref:Voltage-dependent calcium channel gamma-5 subunit n=1 Tax=Ceutorhynchus assimilis TaxID=467358 RepID=A0A9P0DID3_9CUCU|nr:unnamed protein product [Ceutorhynchus assimilis]